MFVLDASIALAWLLPDEESDTAEKVMVLARRSGAIAPALFPLEVANALRSNLRRGRLDATYRDAALDQPTRRPWPGIWRPMIRPCCARR